MTRNVLILAAGFGFVVSSAVAQQSVLVCTEQQQLEQVIGSQGDIRPEDCRQATVSVLESGGERLCLFDFSGSSSGVLSEVRKAATQQKWWARCQDLEAAVR